MLIELDQKKLKLKHKLKMNIHSPKNDIGVSNFLSKNNIWEPFETSIFLKLISKKKFFLDIGANLGYYSIIASKLISKLGKVVAIEPERSNLELLHQNLDMNNTLNVDVIEKACSDKSHASFLKLSKDNLGDHRLSNKKNKDSKNVEVKTTTVDSIINEYGLIPDIVKIDTQGAELKIIKGMKNLLHNSNLKTIFFMEFWPDGLFEQGDKITELIEYISLKSFVIFALFEENGLLVKVKKQDFCIFVSLQKKRFSCSDSSDF